MTFIARNLDEDFALLLECELIDRYRRFGVALCNQTDGGDGARGYRQSDEVKRMPICLIGTVEQCAAELSRRERDWGVSHYVISARASAGIGERLIREVVPAM